MKDKFQQGSSTYRCCDCGKTTRDTGAGEADLDLCRHCYQLGEWENFINNGGSPEKVPAEFRKELGIND